MNYIKYFLFLIILLSACKKEKSTVEPNDDIFVNNDFLIDNSSQWTTRKEWQLGAPYPYDDYLYIDTTVFYFQGDTILSKITMYDIDSISNYPSTNKFLKLHFLKKEYVWCLTNNENPTTSPGTLQITSGTACFIRQDTLHKRVYVAFSDKTYFPMLNIEREYVLYDFGLDVNDTLPYNAWNGGMSNRYEVTSIDHINIDGKNLKVFNVYSDYYNKGTIIEGLGDKIQFLNAGQLLHFQNNEMDFYP